MLATRDDITKYIPQRHPIVMVHALVEADDSHAVTELAIEPDNIFVSNEFFAEPGLVENIAQTAAARAGVTAARKNKPVAIGYIAAVQNLEIAALPEINTTIHTEITADNEILNVLVITGTATQNGKLLAKCNMKIFIDQNKKPQT